MKTKETIAAGQLFMLLFVIKISGFLLFSAALPRSVSLLEWIIPTLLWGLLMFVMWLPLWVYHERFPMDGPVLSARPWQLLYGFLLLWLLAFHFFQMYRFLGEIADELLPIGLLLLILLASVFGASRGIEAVVRFSVLPFIALLIGLALIFFYLYPSYSSSSLLGREALSPYNGVEYTVWLFSGSGELLYAWLLCGQTKGKWLRCSYLWNCFFLLLILLFLLLTAGSLGEYLVGIPFPFYHLLDGAGSLQRLRPLYMGLSVLIFCCTISTELILSQKVLRSCFPVLQNKKADLFLPLGAAFVLFWSVENGFLPGEWLFDRSVICSVMISGGFLLPGMGLIFRSLRQKRRGLRYAVRGAGLMLAVGVLTGITSGCQSIQLNQRMIVQGIGIDREEKQVRLTFLVLLTDEADRENRFRLIYAEGDSVEDGIQQLENQKGKSLLLDQCLFLMLNEAGADHHAETLSYFQHHEHMMKTANIMVTQGSAGEMIRQAVEENGYDPESLNLLSDSRAVHQQTVHFTLFDYISSAHEAHKAMLLPYLRTEAREKTIDNSESYLLSDLPEESLHLNRISTATLQLLKGDIASCTYQTGEGHRVLSVRSVEWTPEVREKELLLHLRVKAASDAPSDKQTQHRLYQTAYCHLRRAAEKPLHQGADPFSLYDQMLSQGTISSAEEEVWGNMLKNSRVTLELELNTPRERLLE